MADRLEARIRSFVVELLDDPPEAPAFPQPDAVVIEGDHPDRRGSMIDTQTRERKSDARLGRWRGPSIAVGAFAAVLIIVAAIAVAVAILDDDASPVAVEGSGNADAVEGSQGASALVGRTGEVVGGLAGSRPDAIEFGEDGTYRVLQGGAAVDTGSYEISGDEISFESSPTDEVLWVENDAFMRVAHTCEGMVGQYRVVSQPPSVYILEAVWDECPTRITVANGLQLSVTG